MSKKHNKSNSQSTAPSSLASSHAAEYRIIKHDLLRVVALNAVYLVAVLALYYTNQKNPYIDRLLGHWLHF